MNWKETICKDCIHQEDTNCVMLEEDVSKGLYGECPGCNEFEARCPKCDGLLKTDATDENEEGCWIIKCNKCDYKYNLS